MSSRIISLNYNPLISSCYQKWRTPLNLFVASTRYGLSRLFPQTSGENHVDGGRILSSSKRNCSFPALEKSSSPNRNCYVITQSKLQYTYEIGEYEKTCHFFKSYHLLSSKNFSRLHINKSVKAIFNIRAWPKEIQKISQIIYLSIYLSICLSISIYRSVYLSIYLSIYLSVYLPIYLMVIVYISGDEPSTAHRVLKSHRNKMRLTYVWAGTQWALPNGYRHNGFVTTCALRHIIMDVMCNEHLHCL